MKALSVACAALLLLLAAPIGNADTPACGTPTTITATTTSAVVLTGKNYRWYLLCQNQDSTNAVFLNFGSDAIANQGIKITAGGNYEVSNYGNAQFRLPAGEVTAITSSGTAAVTCVQYCFGS